MTGVRATTINLNLGVVAFVTEECCRCGVLFAMTKELRDHRLSDKGEFYCPNGHQQSYVGETDAQKAKRLEARLVAEKDQRQAAERRAERARKEAARLKRRAQAAACPCCNRTFVQLARHLKTKHPEYVAAR